jgi:hypothetical protein
MEPVEVEVTRLHPPVALPACGFWVPAWRVAHPQTRQRPGLRRPSAAFSTLTKDPSLRSLPPLRLCVEGRPSSAVKPVQNAGNRLNSVKIGKVDTVGELQPFVCPPRHPVSFPFSRFVRLFAANSSPFASISVNSRLKTLTTANSKFGKEKAKER